MYTMYMVQNKNIKQFVQIWFTLSTQFAIFFPPYFMLILFQVSWLNGFFDFDSLVLWVNWNIRALSYSL